MNDRYTKGFVTGCLGAILLVVLMYVLKAAGEGEPGFVDMYKSAFVASPEPPLDHIIAAVLFILSGGMWGVLYALLVKNYTVLNGFLFGLLPTLWLWIAINAIIGKPLFNGFSLKGLLMPLLFNMVIWGCFVGWFMQSAKPSVNHKDVAA